MPLTTPQVQDAPAYAGQAVPDALLFEVLAAAEQGTGVATGCEVSWSSGFTFNVASGTVCFSGTLYTYGGGSVTLTSASTTDRRDLICMHLSGSTVTAVATVGTPCSVANWTTSSGVNPPMRPRQPTLTNDAAAAGIYVPAAASALSAATITDLTIDMTETSGGGGSGVSAITDGTHSATGAVEFTATNGLTVLATAGSGGPVNIAGTQLQQGNGILLSGTNPLTIGEGASGLNTVASAGTSQTLLPYVINQLTGTAGDACVLTFPTGAAGAWFVLMYLQPASGSAATITWPGSLHWAGGGAAPTLTATNGKLDTLVFIYNGQLSAWVGFVAGLDG